MNVKTKLGEPVIVCNYCKGGHFTRTCPYKSDMEAMQLLQEQLRAKTEPTEETAKELVSRSWVFFISGMESCIYLWSVIFILPKNSIVEIIQFKDSS